MNVEGRARRIVAVFRAGTDGRLAPLLQPLVSSRTDLLGLFIEDSALFRIAELPFAVEVCRVTTEVRRLSTRDLERQMRVLALRAEQIVRRAAETAGSRWSFRKHRGPLSSALADASDIDYVLLGAEQHVLGTIVPAGAALWGPTGLGAAPSGPVAVIFDDSDAGERALDAGIELAERTGRHLIVFLDPGLSAVPSRIYDRLAALRPMRAAVRALVGSDPAGLTSALRRAAPAALVVGADREGFDSERVRVLEREARCPIVLVR